MDRVHDLAFPHALVVGGGSGHWQQPVTVESTRPLTAEGVSAFVRYRDEVATRYGYVTSRWALVDTAGPYAEVFVYSVHALAPGHRPRHHPSSDRRFRTITIEADARPSGNALGKRHEEEHGRALWARTAPGDELVPVALHAGPSGVSLTIQGVGLVPQGLELLLTEPDVLERVGRSALPVRTALFRFRRATDRKVAARVAAGRARPTATLTIGTLSQFAAADDA